MSVSSPRTVKWRLVFTLATCSAWHEPHAASGRREGRATRPACAAPLSAAAGSPAWQLPQPPASCVLSRKSCFTKNRGHVSPDRGGGPPQPSPCSSAGGSGGVRALSLAASVWQATQVL